MNTNYTGIYSLKTPNGTITDVQVVDTSGHSIPLPIHLYISRGVQPPAETLPDQHTYKPNQ